MRKADIKPNIGKRVSLKFSKKTWVIHGISWKGKALLLEEGEPDTFLNRLAANVSDIKLID
jgi:hypothetical protein